MYVDGCKLFNNTKLSLMLKIDLLMIGLGKAAVNMQ